MAIKDGCKIFYTGAKGDFDSLISSAVRKAKKIYSHIKLICVKPYMINDVNTNRDYYATMYDDVIIPDELAGIHYKAAIKLAIIGLWITAILLSHILSAITEGHMR